MKSYDVLWIGTGQATGTVVPRLRSLGKTVAVIEDDKVGGTCVNWGCTPTKALVAAAKVAHMVRTASDFGIEVDSFQVDFPRVMARMNALREQETTGFETWLKTLVDFYPGHAEFVSPHEIRVGDEILHGETIYIHTGTRAARPELPGLDSVNALDNRGLLALNTLPSHLVLLGGSYIALEFAQIFRRFGSKVTLIQRSDRLVVQEDPDFSAEVLALLVGEDIEVHLSTTLERVESRGASIEVSFQQKEKRVSVTGSHLFLGLGRTPNSDRLGLENAGVSVDPRGFIQTDQFLRTNVPHVFAVGDVNGRGAFTHTSVHDGQVLVSRWQGSPWSVNDRVPIHAMFLDPPLARVGMTENQALASGHKVLRATRKMSQIGRAREKGETHGMIKVLVDQQTRRLLGVTIFGVGGDEVINMAAAWLTSGLSVENLQRTVLVHPTVAELLPWIFDDLEPVTGP